MTTRNLRKKVLAEFTSTDGCYSLSDICSVDDPRSFTEQAEEWADESCNNGHFSRWTSFGLDIVNDAEMADKRIKELIVE